MRHEAMPVNRSMAAPIMMAMNDVSPIEPGMVPMSQSCTVLVTPSDDDFSAMEPAISVRGVAPE